MPQYKTHNRFNILCILPIVLFFGYFFFKLPLQDLAIVGSSFCYGSFFMNPDLDLANKIKLFSLRGILTIPFRTYSYVFRHRGLSHSVIFGTVSRVCWLFFFILALSYLFARIGWSFIAWKGFLKTHQYEFFMVLIGLVSADLSHLFLDSVSKKR